MKIYLALTDPQSDAALIEALEEVFGAPCGPCATLVHRNEPEATRAVLKGASAVFGVWSPEDASAVGELAFAAGAGLPVYVVAKGDAPPWFCSGTGAGGHYSTALKAVAAYLRDLTAARSVPYEPRERPLAVKK